MCWCGCHVGAAQRLQAIEAWRISTVTYIELAQGSRDKADLARLKKGLAARNTEIVPLTPSISPRASALIDSLALAHGMRLANALICATAIELQATLLTANAKHFATVEGSQIDIFEP